MSRSELSWSKERLVAEIIRLRDREDALLKSVVLREQDALKAANDRANLRVVVDEQLKEIQRCKERETTALNAYEAAAKERDRAMEQGLALKQQRPITWAQVIDLAEAMSGGGR